MNCIGLARWFTVGEGECIDDAVDVDAPSGKDMDMGVVRLARLGDVDGRERC